MSQALRGWLALVAVLACAVHARAGLPLPAPSPAAYVAMGRQAAADLADLKLERPLARSVLLETVGGLAFGLTDEISLVLRALQIEIQPGAVEIPVHWLLERLNLRSLDASRAVHFLETGTPEAAARVSMVLEGCRLGADATVNAADELLVGIAQLVRVVMKAVVTIEKISAKLELVPGAGRATRAIRRAVVKRLMRALDSVVFLATRPMRQPLRSRIRAASALVSLVLYKWDNLAIGLPGPASAAVLIGKAYVLGSQRFGAFARLQRSLDAAVQRAGERAPTGSLEQAAARAMAAPAGGEPGVLDAVLIEAKRRSRLSGIERHSAKLAGVASDIAAIVMVVDPTGIAKVVAAVTRALQGGLVLHATFLSASMLHRIPREVSRMVDAAFDPERPAVDVGAARKRVLASDALLAARGQRLDIAVDDLLEGLARPGTLDRLEPRVVELEAASDGFVPAVRARSAASLSAWGRGTPEAALLEHDLAAAALLAGCLEAPVGKSSAVPRRLAEAAEGVRRSGAALAAPQSKMDAGAEDEGVVLVIEVPETVRAGELVQARVRNAGGTAAAGVEAHVAGAQAGEAAAGTPASGAQTHAPGISLGTLAPDGTADLPAVTAGAADSAITILVRDGAGAETARTVWVRP